ncbi:MAG: hypothetical protein M3Y53_01570 [Thermoproteota archaeon]|nr:hypothetical protein [Thermoproteota archaeon]
MVFSLVTVEWLNGFGIIGSCYLYAARKVPTTRSCSKYSFISSSVRDDSIPSVEKAIPSLH